MHDRRQSERQGRVAEALAMLYLRLTGHRILAYRWRGSAGEIDIVARRGRGIIFCEVKFRQHADDGGIPTARQRLPDGLAWRFDLVQISPPFRGIVAPLRHLKNAWQCDA